MGTPLTAQQIAAIVAQAFVDAGLGPGAPAAAPAPRAAPSMISRPREYTGGDDYEHFRRECQLFIAENPDNFPNGRSKISFVLSYLKAGQAAAWAQNYIDQNTANNTITIPADYDAFLTSLDASFVDPTKKTKALERFHKAKQGNRSAEEFFVEFNQILIAAGLTDAQHDGIIIDQLKKAVHKDIYRGVA